MIGALHDSNQLEMICHKHKCIFVHIPKTAGMSIYSFFFPDKRLHHSVPNYDILFGWCPKRKIHMQHATSQQLVETGLISRKDWNEYFKFSFTRNPWDRAYSDYLWVQEFSKKSDNFKHYIGGSGRFKKIMNCRIDQDYLGDHLLQQKDFVAVEGEYKLDFIGRFENFQKDIQQVLHRLNIYEPFTIMKNRTNGKYPHYSLFYTESKKKMVEERYLNDISFFNYSFDDRRKGIYQMKKFL